MDLLLHPESKTLEFKRDLSSMEPILKTIVAFANTAGGTIVIGRDNDGTVVGIKDVFRAEETLANSIADSIAPEITPEIEIATIDKKDLLVIRVSHWRGPFYLKMEGMPKGVYIRLGSTSRLAGPELLAELQRSHLVPSYDQQPLFDLAKSAIDSEMAAHLFERAGKPFSEEKLRSLGILISVSGKLIPSIGGLILFGKKQQKEEFIPEVEVRCARFLGVTKTSILDHLDIEGTIIDAIEKVPKFIARNTRLTAEFGQMQRKDIPEYPPTAVREALINAIAHADYSIRSSHIQIAIFNDRLEIQNPGMLPFGFTLEDLKSGVSRIRNRVISQTFHALRFMEKWGSGYRRIIDACKEGGYKEPKWEELGTSVRITFYPHVQSFLPEKMQFLAREEPSNLTERETLLLGLFQGHKSLPFREIAKNFPYPISERTLRYDLAQLKAKGVLRSKGQGRALVWIQC